MFRVFNFRIESKNMEAKSIEFPIYEVLEKKDIISEASEYELLEFLDNNEGLNIYLLSKRLGGDKNLIYGLSSDKSLILWYSCCPCLCTMEIFRDCFYNNLNVLHYVSTHR